MLSGRATHAILRGMPPRLDAPTEVHRRQFGTTPDGTTVDAFDLTCGDVTATVLSYGGVLQSVRLPDRDGVRDEVLLGHDDLAGYLADEAFLGATVGRFANRIGGGRFTLDGREHRLPQNHGSSTLHGGPGGFHARVWEAREVADGVLLGRRSPDGEMGFPGTLDVEVTVTLRAEGLRLAYSARTDAPTVVNLTNHAYWNLAGAGTRTVEDHLVQVLAEEYVPVDADFVPLGHLEAVAGTPLDLRDPVRLGDGVRRSHLQLLRTGGYDHCWVRPGTGTAETLLARVLEPRSGRRLEVSTDQPGVQLYSGNMLDGSVVGRGGRTLRQGDGLCLETQHLPDSPNQPDFPSTVLRPGETFSTTTLLAFGMD